MFVGYRRAFEAADGRLFRHSSLLGILWLFEPVKWSCHSTEYVSKDDIFWEPKMQSEGRY